ncbi:TetR/AcrR family transcriptional regulator [Micromonospora sp. WMMD812]|uniref:TetR/AcrR family transcriptional regulator n=1 Tax=Micromonospora sp. WMMD812 TaxID=3015152 RepID=UPI00248AE1F1|nr:TetR/AcrR family transcriptional regulator [Micromonospora sp. WMMD812]WBB67383.1 TetR/AcrR family transcriptional regulator [Micromonospora sp. WMMD812]
MASRSGGPRERYRAQVRAEIKQAALDQVATGGAGAVALTGIAKRLGVSGPALYKYFASRDDLLTELILDAYADVAAAVSAAAEASASAPARARLHALAAAYRDWALAHPHSYLLLTGPPSPTYQAPPETVDRARAVLGPFLTVLAEGRPGPAATTLRGQLDRWAEATPAVTAWVRAFAPDADPGDALAGAVTAWARLHGVVGLATVGLFNGMGFDPAALLDTEIDTLADGYGLP